MTEMNELRKDILQAAYRAGGHVPSAFSILEIVWTLYSRVMREGDRFILSKGHGALALYAVLADLGYIDWEDYGAGYGGHPDIRTPGVEATSGSLGHGLAYAAGLALAKKIRCEGGRVFCLVGDGECQEGSIWEAARIIRQLMLNIVVIIDNNYTHEDPEIVNKWECFGFSYGYANGHDPEQLAKILDNSGPLCVFAETLKGKGVERMEADPGAWHHRAPTKGELDEMLKELSCAPS